MVFEYMSLSVVENIDCMTRLREAPDNHWDLAICDPPYGYGSVTYMPRTRHEAFGGYIDSYEVTIATLDNNQRAMSRVEVVHAQTSKETTRSFVDANYSPAPEYFEQLLRVSKNQIIWGGNYFMLPPSRGFVIWKKTTVAESFSMAMCEYAWLSFNTNSKLFEGAPQGKASDPRIHPTQKPYALYKWLLTNYAKPGDTILDTHLGSGSSRIAAYDLGFDFTGYELDGDYFNAQEERFARHIAQPQLFEIPRVEPIQEVMFAAA
jgi:site-specific DNA-methyltransferase (adenine-specific)